MSKPRLKTRAYSAWRIDQDYWDKLSEGETAFLAEFIDRFYHNFPNHNSGSHDIVTITDDQARDLLSPTQRAYYTPEDYMENPCPRSASTPKTRLSE